MMSLLKMPQKQMPMVMTASNPAQREIEVEDNAFKREFDVVIKTVDGREHFFTLYDIDEEDYMEWVRENIIKADGFLQCGTTFIQISNICSVGKRGIF